MSILTGKQCVFLYSAFPSIPLACPGLTNFLVSNFEDLSYEMWHSGYRTAIFFRKIHIFNILESEKNGYKIPLHTTNT